MQSPVLFFFFKVVTSPFYTTLYTTRHYIKSIFTGKQQINSNAKKKNGYTFWKVKGYQNKCNILLKGKKKIPSKEETQTKRKNVLESDVQSAKEKIKIKMFPSFDRKRSFKGSRKCLVFFCFLLLFKNVNKCPHVVNAGRANYKIRIYIFLWG